LDRNLEAIQDLPDRCWECDHTFFEWAIPYGIAALARTLLFRQLAKAIAVSGKLLLYFLRSLF
jgi:hypothetical protein